MKLIDCKKENYYYYTPNNLRFWMERCEPYNMGEVQQHTIIHFDKFKVAIVNEIYQYDIPVTGQTGVTKPRKGTKTTPFEEMTIELVYELAYTKYSPEKEGIEKDINRFKNNPKKYERKKKRLDELNVIFSDINKLK